MTKDEVERAIETTLAEKTKNLQTIADIKAQVGAAKASAIMDGVYANAKWFQAASTALRHAGRRDQEYGTELSRLRKTYREILKIGSNTFERFFMDVARERLSGEVFQAIAQEAARRQ